MSKTRPKGRRRPRRKLGQIGMYVLSLVVIVSMAIGYVLLAAPPRDSGSATPSAAPTIVAPSPVPPTATPTPTPTPSPS